MNLALTLAFAIASSPPVIEGYVDQQYYEPGNTVTAYVSTEFPEFRAVIINESTQENAFVIHNIPSLGVQASPPDAWNGAEWMPTFTFDLPPDLPSGPYSIKFKVTGQPAYYDTFIVSPPAPTASVAVIGYGPTKNAYNGWCDNYGCSVNLYYDGCGLNGGQQAFSLSILRPDDRSNGRGQSDLRFREFARWMSTRYAADWYEEEQVTLELLQNYDVVILPVHHEYTSRTFTEACFKYAFFGGGLLVPSADNFHWQIRWIGDLMWCFRQFAPTHDPQAGECDEAGYWPHLGLSTGTLYANWTSQESKWFFPGMFLCMAPEHPIFAGTNLQFGDPIFESAGENDNNRCSSWAGCTSLYARPHTVLWECIRTDPKVPPVGPSGVTEAICTGTYTAFTPEYGDINGSGGQVISFGSIGQFFESIETPLLTQIMENCIDHLLLGPIPVECVDPQPASFKHPDIYLDPNSITEIDQ